MKNPAQIADDFIYWLGENVDSIESAKLHHSYARENNIPQSQFDYVFQHLIKDGLIESIGIKLPDGSTNYGPRLTFKGWGKYNQLLQKPNSKLAFMAMQFHNAKFTSEVFEKIATRVLKETGFGLRKLPEADQPMGLIDDHLRVEIKRSRFLVAEISELNPNVIWEAGFAEGLGKKVVYLCEETIFDDLSRKRVFDIEHQLTIPWSEKNLDKAIDKLVDTICNTFDDALGP
jgi:hypothetical protein